MFTSEITHGGIAHIASNMIMFLVWGPILEKHFGTLLYAFLNFLIGILSNLMTIGLQYALSEYAPKIEAPVAKEPLEM
jgi:membrane associated rhomboid family serine protease